MIYKIAVCDDEQAEIAYLTKIVSAWAKQSGSVAALSAFESAEAFLFHYTEQKNYDIILLDIEMKEMNGVELARKIREENESSQIIFITGFPDFISEGYEVSALHYLMKPVKEEKLFEVLDRAAKNLGRKEKAVLFAVDGETVRIPESRIVSVEAFAHTSRICTTDGTIEVNMSISDVEKKLGTHFARCHRSYIVGLKYITSITKAEITLDDGTKLPLSRGKSNAVNQAFIRYFKGE